MSKMYTKKIRWKKSLYQKVFKICADHSWLIKKEAELQELIKSCSSVEAENLVFELLNKFTYLNADSTNFYLKQLADFIVNRTNFDEKRTQIVATAMGVEADSSQWVLQAIKPMLADLGWGNVQTVNKFTNSLKIARTKGLNQIIVLDEFVGTGKSIIQRLEYLSKNIQVKYEIHCCFMAGMNFGLKEIEKLGYKVFCLYRLNKALSEFKSGDQLTRAVEMMKKMESNLKPLINDKNLSDYSLGHGQAEALYCADEKNVPNSVFPIFWWPLNGRDKRRRTILTRYEKGISWK